MSDRRLAPRAATLRRVVYLAWASACVVLLILLIGSRWLRYTSWSSTPILNAVLREMMILDLHAFLWPWAYTRLTLRTVLLALAVVVIALHRRLPGRVVRRVGGVWRLTPAVVSLLLGAMLWLQYLFDLNPTVTAVCATSLALAWVLALPRVTDALPRRAVTGLWALFFAYWLFAASDHIDRATITVWALALLATQLWVAPRIGRSDLALLRVAAVMPINLLAAMLPFVVPLHGGIHLGDGLAYSFCEAPDRPTLYATVPVCDSVRASFEDCRDGRVVEYDLATMKPVASHGFFSSSFYGRLELLVCLEDEVEVAVQASWYQGKRMVQSAMSFPVADPRHFNPMVVGIPDVGLGVLIAYDQERDALFYTGEFTNAVARYDRRAGKVDDIGGEAFFHQWFQPVTLEAHTGSLMLHTTSIHPGRNRIYLVDWMNGRYAYAVDLTTLEVVARYDADGGGALGVAVDPERDRLFVSSVWGLEVFDLATDTLIARLRTGTGNRPVIIDRFHNRLYVSSEVEGRIRILDRDTLALIGQIPVGMGTRYPHLSRDGKYLFASSSLAHYYWDADALVPPR